MKKILINFKIDKKDHDIIEDMRNNHKINISALLRDLLVKYHQKLHHEKDM